MSQQEDLFQYDEEDAVKFIQNFIPQELKERFTTDDINYIIDLVYEYYESKGFFNSEEDSEVEIDEDEIVAFVLKNAKKNGFESFTAEEVGFVIQGEMEYCDSLGLFE